MTLSTAGGIPGGISSARKRGFFNLLREMAGGK